MNDNKPTVIIDTREKAPYNFAEYIPRYFEGAEKGSLKTGDYSLVGYEDKIVVERKSLYDYLSSISTHHARFWKELARLAKIRHKLIVVEGDLDRIQQRKYQHQIEPIAVIKLSVRIIADFGIPVVFAGNRPMGLTVTARFLRFSWEKQLKQEAFRAFIQGGV